MGEAQPAASFGVSRGSWGPRADSGPSDASSVRAIAEAVVGRSPMPGRSPCGAPSAAPAPRGSSERGCGIALATGAPLPPGKWVGDAVMQQLTKGARSAPATSRP